MKASIIVPVYNSEKYLKRCLDSIIEQSEKDYEIICIDDCSPDGCNSILKKYLEKYPDKIVVIENEDNIGQGKSRMKGIAEAKGDYIFFVDSDDYIEKNYIERFLKEVEDKYYDMVISGYTKDINGKYVKHDINDSIWTRVCYPVACCKMYRKQFIIDNNIDFSDARIGEDIYFTLAMFCSEAKTKIIHYFGYYYFLNNNSTTRTITYDKKHEKYVSEMFLTLDRKYNFEKMKTPKKYYVEYAYVANMVNALITYGHGCKPKIMKEKYEFFVDDLKNRFPDYKLNPYFNFNKAKGVPLKIKLAVSISHICMKMKLGQIFYYIISLV